jgi:trehalose-phosphatase
MITQPYREHLMIVAARKAWEIRPRLNWHKGSALLYLLREFSGPPPLVFCAGDDETDEHMFAALPSAISIRIGGRRQTHARYRLEDERELFLALTALRQGISSGNGDIARPLSGLSPSPKPEGRQTIGAPRRVPRA